MVIVGPMLQPLPLKVSGRFWEIPTLNSLFRKILIAPTINPETVAREDVSPRLTLLPKTTVLFQPQTTPTRENTTLQISVPLMPSITLIIRNSFPTSDILETETATL